MKEGPTPKIDPSKNLQQASFNRRESLLEAVAFAAERFLKATPWQTSIAGILERLGNAAEANSVSMYQKDHGQDSSTSIRKLCQWMPSRGALQNDSPSERICPAQVMRTHGWIEAMKANGAVQGPVKDDRGTGWFAAVPIHVQDEWWGFIELDKCLFEPPWSEAELGVFQTAARVIGAAIQRQHSENRLRESERRYKELADFLPQSVFEIDLNGKLTFANRSASEFFGYTEEDFKKGLNALDMFTTEDRKRVCEAVRKRMAGKSWGSYEFNARRKDGVIFPVLVEAAPIEKDGKPVGHRGILVDITARKQIEEKLARSEKLYRAIVHHSPLGIMHFDQDGVVVDCNEKFLCIFGSCREEMIGFRMLESLHDEAMQTAVQAALAGKIGRFEGDYFSLTGEKPVSADIVFSRINSEEGEFLCGLCIAEDASERKRTEQALRQSEARYRAIVEDQTELISRFAPDGTLTFVNDAYCRYFGETADQLIGHQFWHHVPAEDQEKFKRHLVKLNRDNQVATIEHQVYTSTGEVRWQQWTDRAICDDRGRVVEFQAVGRDITERRKAEEALRESEEQLRYLSSQILQAQEKERQRIARDLHDSIIQSLATIKINLRINVKHLVQNRSEQARQSFESVISMIQETIEEVRRVYTDLRPSMLDNLGILTTMSWACREFEQTYRQVRVLTKMDVEENEISETLKIVIYRIMQEALNNIAKHSKADRVDISLSKDDGRIQLTIEDNGCGFDVARMLSGHNNRHGLGLVSMKERTELSGGTFAIESAEQKGTTIRSSWQCDHLEHK
ncbi:MAG: PAS domain S-box protein [Desulforhabdus sp.]|jgi:PAS domain S-box-containing protein|nr:PAS domain S-box protein [Desulforhabdus sp.]